MARPVWPLVTFWKCWSWSTLWTHRTGFRFLIHFLYHQGGDSAYLYLLEDVFNFPFFWHVFAFYFFFFYPSSETHSQSHFFYLRIETGRGFPTMSYIMFCLFPFGYNVYHFHFMRSYFHIFMLWFIFLIQFPKHHYCWLTELC